MTLNSREQAEQYLNQLKANLTYLMGKNEFDRAKQMGTAAGLLQEWMSSDMQGELPIDKALLDPVQPVQVDGVAPALVMRSGEILRGKKGNYSLDRQLGAGKYGQVWMSEVQTGELLERGIHRVVIKVMNANLTEEDKRQFSTESLVLAHMHSYEREHDLLVDGVSLVPVIHEQNLETGDQGYIIESLADGRTVIDIVHESGAMSERDGLAIGAQFCRVLEILQEGANQWYKDFQPANVYWNAETRRIMVIDWNLLGSLTEEGRASDVRAAARLIYQSLMGVPAPVGTSIRALAQPTASWDRLSLGAQSVLSKALNLNPAKHYKTPAELRAALEQLLSYWDKDPYALVDAAQGYSPYPISRSGKATIDESQRHVAVILSIAAIRARETGERIQRIEEMQQQVGNWQGGRKYLDAGKGQFESRGYDEAIESLQQAIEESIDPQSTLDAYRWLNMAQGVRQVAAKRKIDKDKEDALRALKYLQDKNYPVAAREFEQLSKLVGGEPFGNLNKEAQFCVLMQQGEVAGRGTDWKAAAKAFREAGLLLIVMSKPYADALTDLFGDPAPRLAEMEKNVRRYEEVTDVERSIEAAFQRNHADGCKEMRDNFNELPGNDGLVRLTVEKCHKYITACAYPHAHDLVTIGLDYAPNVPELSTLDHTIDYFMALDRAWRRDDKEGMKQAVDGLQEIKGSETWLGAYIEKRFDEVGEKGDFLNAKLLFDVMPSAANSRTDLKKRLDTVWPKLTKTVRDTLALSYEGGLAYLLKLMQRRPGDTDIVEVSVDAIKYYLDKQDYARAYDLGKAVRLLAENVTPWLFLSRALRDARIAYTSNDLGAANQKLQDAREIVSKNAALRQTPSDNYVGKLAGAWFKSALESNDIDLAERLLGLLDVSAQNTAKGSLTELKNRLAEDSKSDLASVRQAIQAGNEALDNQQGSSRLLMGTSAAIEQLRESVTITSRHTDPAWREKRTELQTVLAQLEVHSKGIEKKREALRTGQKALLLQLTPLMTDVTSGLPLQQSLKVLDLVISVCDNLLTHFPDDSESISWQTTHDSALELKAQIQMDAREKTGQKATRSSLFKDRRAQIGGVIGAILLVVIVGGLIFTRLAGGGPDDNKVILTDGTPKVNAIYSTRIITATSVVNLTVAPDKAITPTVAPLQAAVTKTVPASTAMPSPTITPDPTVAAVADEGTSDISISFPPSGTIYAAFPWQVVVTSTTPLTLEVSLVAAIPLIDSVGISLTKQTVSFTETISLASLPATQVDSSYIYTWTRTVDDLRQLPDGQYNLVLRDANSTANMNYVVILIQHTSAVTGSLNAIDGITVYLSPGKEPSTKLIPAVDTQVEVIGRVLRADQTWCYFNSTEMSSRWALCADLGLDQTHSDTLPLLAP